MIMFTRNPVDVIDGDKYTMLSHNAAAAGNLSVLRVLLFAPQGGSTQGRAAIPADARDVVRPTAVRY